MRQLDAVAGAFNQAHREFLAATKGFFKIGRRRRAHPMRGVSGWKTGAKSSTEGGRATYSPLIRTMRSKRDQLWQHLYIPPSKSGLMMRLRVGECDDPWERYKGGTAYALDVAGHNSGNLYFFAEVKEESRTRKGIEANLIFDLQPRYNNQHKKRPPRVRFQCCHTGDVPKTLYQSQ